MARIIYSANDGKAVGLEWTLNKLLKGAGPGADPTEIDVPVALTYTELVGTDTKTHATTEWTDWDLSAIVPVGTKFAEVMIIGNAGNSAGVRKDGSALERRYGLANTVAAVWTVKVEATRIVEVYGHVDASPNYFLMGYWS